MKTAVTIFATTSLQVAQAVQVQSESLDADQFAHKKFNVQLPENNSEDYYPTDTETLLNKHWERFRSVQDVDEAISAELAQIVDKPIHIAVFSKNYFRDQMEATNQNSQHSENDFFSVKESTGQKLKHHVIELQNDKFDSLMLPVRISKSGENWKFHLHEGHLVHVMSKADFSSGNNVALFRRSRDSMVLFNIFDSLKN